MSSIQQRAAAALERIKAGHAPMRIPAEESDPDLVITDLLAELAGAQQSEAAMRREREVAQSQLKVMGVALRAAEEARELAVGVAAVLRGQLEGWANGAPNVEDTKRALTATAELAAALVQSVRDRWEAEVVAAVTGKGLAYVSKALNDALVDTTAAAAQAIAEEAIRLAKGEAAVAESERDQLRLALVECGCTQPLPSFPGWANTRALKAKGELLALQRAVRRVFAFVKIGLPAGGGGFGGMDEHERKALEEALAK